MFRRLTGALLLLAAGALPVSAQTAMSSHPSHAMMMHGTPMDSVQCAMLHAALSQHFGALSLDSTQKSALHTMMLAQAGVVHLDSASLASVHSTLHEAMVGGALDGDHIAMLHTMLSDSTHLAAIRGCFDAGSPGKAGDRR